MGDGVAGADDLAAAAVTRPTFSWGAGTHVGGVREHNEDAFYVSPEACVVADGMGGHEAGEVASQLVTHIVADVFGSRQLDVTELPGFVSALNAAVLRKGVENDTRGMGTTVVGVALADNGDESSVVVFHVGDSRCYRLRTGVMTQLTSDHSHVHELVQAGRITPEEALTHPLRNVITRALGADVAVEADFNVLDEENCRILLCSDGLSGEIDDDRIWDLLTSHVDPTEAAIALIDAVLDGPARDNVTVVVVDIDFPEPDPAHPSLANPSASESTDPKAEDTADITADVTADAGADPTEDLMIVRPWAPPDAIDRRSDGVDRPSASSDAPPWASPDADSADPTTVNDQETGHAREQNH